MIKALMNFSFLNFHKKEQVEVTGICQITVMQTINSSLSQKQSDLSLTFDAVDKLARFLLKTQTIIFIQVLTIDKRL